MNRDSVAKRVRLEKEAHPERFCPVAGCLWRTTIMGKLEPCRKHPGLVAMMIPKAEVSK